MCPGVTAAQPVGVSGGRSGSSTIRVLHVNAGNLYGGVETILVTLARLRHLYPAMEPEFALSFEGRLSRELNAAGVTVHMLGEARISRPWTVRKSRRRLREILRRERFDTVMCHMPWSLVVLGPAVRAAEQRLGFFAHAFHTGRNWLERLARLTEPDFVIANSRYTQRGVANLFPGVPSGVAYPPVVHSETEVRCALVRGSHNTAEEAVVIVQTSRLEAWKGHTLHLEALAQLQDLGNWVYWVVGGAQRPEEQAYLAQLLKTAQELGIAERVRFLGQRTDVRELLAAADIFCQPNLRPEPFGIVFIEALWAGLPVISTAMGGVLEIVDHSCGLLVEPGSTSRLSAALRRLITDANLRAELGRKGGLRAQQLCDPATQMKVLSELCRSQTIAASK